MQGAVRENLFVEGSSRRTKRKKPQREHFANVENGSSSENEKRSDSRKSVKIRNLVDLYQA